MNVVLVHDYLTQRGGAERVVLSMLRAFPGIPLYTSLYEPGETYEDFTRADIRTLPLNRLRLLRRKHRLALPLLAPAFSRLQIQADVVVCSSSGWAHGAVVEGRKIVYCHTPARWLYQTERYLGKGPSAAKTALLLLRPYLLRWDRRAARTADRYLTQSTAVRARIRSLYGIDAELCPAPHTINPSGVKKAIKGLIPGYFLCVSRLLPYKNVASVVQSFTSLPRERLVVAGKGPLERSIRATAPPNVSLVGAVSDEELRWLYANASGILSASYEDYGLTPLEGAAFGKPSAVLRWGGYLDTVIEEETGVFFNRPEPYEISEAIRRLASDSFSPQLLKSHADRFSETRFATRLREIVSEEAGRR